MNKYFSRAIDNVIRHGDTDIFPFPVEKQVLADNKQSCVELLSVMHAEFPAFINNYPPVNDSGFTAAGYAGFRWATQIDPFWNVYFLALVLSQAESFERARLPIGNNNIYSYRSQWNEDDATIFNKDVGWPQFVAKSLENSEAAKYVLVTDISDFYSRIYHHRLENAIRRATDDTGICGRIMLLLKVFAKNVSYGLPVGGSAARILSEVVLNSTDRLLRSRGYTFCRFADDYRFFAASEGEAYGQLVYLSEKLLENEGLSLQKAKTRIMTSSEFRSSIDPGDEGAGDVPPDEARRFLRLSLHYNPYSTTALDDYERLRDEVRTFDILGMLARELKKTRVHQSLTRKLLTAAKHVDPMVADELAISLVDNLETLYPVFPQVLRLLRAISSHLSADTSEWVYNAVRQLFDNESYIVSVPTHAAFAIRFLANDPSEAAENVLARVYETATSLMLRRDVILAMTNRGADYWISDVRKSYNRVSSWEQTALYVSSYGLGDEGRHWRLSVREQITPMLKPTSEWAAARKQAGRPLELPL